MAFRKRGRNNVKFILVVIIFAIWSCIWLTQSLDFDSRKFKQHVFVGRGNVNAMAISQGKGNSYGTKTSVAFGVDVVLKAKAQSVEVNANDNHQALPINSEDTIDNVTELNDLEDDNESKGEIFHYKMDFFKELRVRKHKKINCQKLIEGDGASIKSARKFMKSHNRVSVPLKAFTWILDCDLFKAKQGYILDVPSKSEKDFPLAFAIIVYRDVEQVERLLRAVYRPHNYYCLHVDVKTKQADRDALNSISSCFDNVFQVENSVNVTWGEFSVLQAELLCMKLLWRFKSWKYYINLTGQEFPLKTNLEIVEILKTMQGANIADGTSMRYNFV